MPTILVEIHFSVEDYHETLGDQVAAAIKEQVWNVLVRDNTDRGTCDDFKYVECMPSGGLIICVYIYLCLNIVA